VTQRRIVVTGASSGIGWETSLLLAEPGVGLVLAARRRDRLEELAELCRARGVDWVEACECDLTDLESVRRLGDRVGETSGGELCLVNNAGNAVLKPFLEMTPEQIENQIQVNFVGPAWVTHVLLPHVLASQGQIVNVLSVAATMPLMGATAYGAAKAGSHLMARSLALEVRKRGVRITNIHPGATDTPIWEGQDWRPATDSMLPVAAVAEAIRDALCSPRDRALDEIVLMPPGGLG